jgi:hypothetical protein
MNFIQAVQVLSNNKYRVVCDIVVNGEKEELVLVDDAPFIKTPRQPNAKPDNYIFSSPSVEEILTESWEAI